MLKKIQLRSYVEGILYQNKGYTYIQVDFMVS